jgi:hypothetical protein
VVDRTIGASRHPQAPARQGAAPLVLFALEPRAYSEAIALAVASLREEMQVMAVDPEELPAVADFSVPAIVLSSRPMPEGHDGAVRWAEYRPYEDPDVIRVDGRAEHIPGFGLEDVLGLVDRLAAELPSRRPVAGEGSPAA